MSAREKIAPRGFRWAGVRTGLRKTPDLALLVSDAPASVAGVFTRSALPGAPVVLTRARVRKGQARVLLVNAGVANVGFGARGLRDAEAMARAAASQLGLAPGDALVASTGVIGAPLPLAKIRAAVPAAARALRADARESAARAILTTDTRTKNRARSFRIGARRHAVAGIAKGAGMIEPNMATMLALLATDAAVSPALLRALWREVADATFNRVTVDGETSTSDMALVFANGAGGGVPLRSARGAGARALERALFEVAEELARDIARDGEGATHRVTVTVRAAKSAAEAERAARRVANSLLVKTAVFGNDPNWGRIVQTIAVSGVRFRAERLRVLLCGVAVFARGVPCGAAARARAQRRMRREDIGIEVELGAGAATARVWTCDLSTDYVRINAEYTT